MCQGPSYLFTCILSSTFMDLGTPPLHLPRLTTHFTKWKNRHSGTFHNLPKILEPRFKPMMWFSNSRALTAIFSLIYFHIYIERLDWRRLISLNFDVRMSLLTYSCNGSWGLDDKEAAWNPNLEFVRNGLTSRFSYDVRLFWADVQARNRSSIFLRLNP